jgi:hypothetical protein
MLDIQTMGDSFNVVLDGVVISRHSDMDSAIDWLKVFIGI